MSLIDFQMLVLSLKHNQNVILLIFYAINVEHMQQKQQGTNGKLVYLFLWAYIFCCKTCHLQLKNFSLGIVILPICQNSIIAVMNICHVLQGSIIGWILSKSSLYDWDIIPNVARMISTSDSTCSTSATSTAEMLLVARISSMARSSSASETWPYAAVFSPPSWVFSTSGALTRTSTAVGGDSL